MDKILLPYHKISIEFGKNRRKKMGLLFITIVFLLGTIAIIYASIRVAINEEAFFVFMIKKVSTVVGGVFLLYTVMSVLLSGVLDNSNSGKSEIVFIGELRLDSEKI